jgi:hypothetical protein
MLDNICTIKGKNGEVYQGFITWVSQDEFWFSPDGRVYKQFWGKTDYWQILGYGVKIFKI